MALAKRKKYYVKFIHKPCLICSSIAELAEELGYSWVWMYKCLKNDRIPFKQGKASTIKSIHVVQDDKLVKVIRKRGALND